MLDFVLSPNIVHTDDPHDQLMLDNTKRSPSHLYICQPYTVQIIQLVEGPPPPRRKIIDLDESSSYASSSECSSSSDEEESICSSYCSSAEELLEEQAYPSQTAEADSVPQPSSLDSYSLRMKRILSWRENFSAHLSATISEPSLSATLKRKLQYEDKEHASDVMSRSSKRSRSQASSQDGDSADSSLGDHSCPACDACFDSERSLRQHGRDAGVNEACFVAVEYAFE